MRNPAVFKCILCIYIAFVLCSAVPDLLPGIFIRLLPIAILLFCGIVYTDILLRNRSFIWSLVYAIFLFFAATDHKLSGLGYGLGGYDTVLIDIGFILPSISLSAILMENKLRNNSLRLIDITIYSSLIVSFCFIIPVLLFDPSVARQIAFMSSDKLEEDLVQFKFGFWDYAMCHMIALAFPLFTGLYFNSKNIKAKLFFGAMALIVLYIVLKLSITTTFIYILVAICLMVYHRFGRHQVLGTIVILCLSFFCVSFAEPLLEYLADIYKGTAMAPKIADFQDMIAGGTGNHDTVDGRLNYQQGALDGFLNNILIGSTYDGTGGHSVLLNRLGTTGLFGFIPFILMLYYQFKQWLNQIPSSSKFYYLISWLGVVILLYSKNLFGSAGSLFIAVVIPCLAMTFISQKSILFPKSK